MHPKRRDRRQRGAVLIEAAFVVPLFFGLIFGIIEGALLLRDWLTIANITGDAGRAASTFGNDIDADFNIIQEAADAAAAIGTGRIDRVVIFKASGPNTSVPAACLTGSTGSGGSNPCNVYLGAAFQDDDPAHFRCVNGVPSVFNSCHWAPTSRKIALNGSGGPPDYLGIFVRLRHEPMFGILGGERYLERTSIFRLEPQVLNG